MAVSDKPIGTQKTQTGKKPQPRPRKTTAGSLLTLHGSARPHTTHLPPRPPPSAPPAKARKLSYKDQRDYDQLPARIEAIDAGIARDEALLADPALYVRDPKRFAALTQAIDAARAEKDAAEMRWLELAEQVEGLG